jgi:hypothetical protein
MHGFWSKDLAPLTNSEAISMDGKLFLGASSRPSG